MSNIGQTKSNILNISYDMRSKHDWRYAQNLWKTNYFKRCSINMEYCTVHYGLQGKDLKMLSFVFLKLDFSYVFQLVFSYYMANEAAIGESKLGTASSIVTSILEKRDFYEVLKDRGTERVKVNCQCSRCRVFANFKGGSKL